MKVEDLENKIKRDREEFDALPTSDKIKSNKERRIISLLNVGYITPDEAKKYREPLTELPTDRKDLVVVYYLMGLGTFTEETPSIGMIDNIKKTISDLPNTAMASLTRGGSLADGMTEEQIEDSVSKLGRLHTEESIKKAENFVGAKRARFRKKLQRFVRLEIAYLLFSEPKDSELDTIPYLKDFLQEKGYKAKAKNLSDADKEAIEAAAEYYLNLMELSFLNMTTLIRQEEYKKYQNDDDEWSETFYYRDELDEVLTSYNTPLVLDFVIGGHYNNDTAKGAIEAMQELYNRLITEDEYKELKESKFKYIFEEDKVC